MRIMNINSEDFTPSYVKIQNYILDKIQRGVYNTGDKIPSENELAQMFSVSRVTANAAIKELSIMGVVERIKGKGTFVCAPNSVPTVSKVMAPNIQLKLTGEKTHQLICSTIIEAYPELKARFGLEEGALVYEIIRSVSNRGNMTALDFSYIPFDAIGPLPIEPEEISKSYLHEYLKSHTNLEPGFIKIYINTPHYPFLKLGNTFDTAGRQLIFWTTDVLDKEKRLIATTITVSPEGQEDQPFITFSIN